MDLQQLLEAASAHLQKERHLLPMYLHLIVSALFPIYAGAHASLSRPSSAAKPAKKSKDTAQADADAGDEEEDEEVVQQMEGMSARDALIYPVVAAITLGGLYFLITKYGANAINLIFGWYFSIAGVFSVAKLVSDAAIVSIGFIFPTYFARYGRLYKVEASKRKAVAEGAEKGIDSPIPFVPAWTKTFYDAVWNIRGAIKQRYTVRIRTSDSDDKTHFTAIHVVGVIAGIAASLYANLIAKPWYLTNLQGFAVCYTAFQMLSPTSFTTGSLLLAGLFCYDVWAVFFTPLMVTVAKNLDQPIKLVFPRPEEAVQKQVQVPFLPPAPKTQYSMLGLGDIVLPGIMIALALRFDLHLFYLAKQRKASTIESKSEEPENVIEKAPYVSTTGNFGDRFWTARLPASARPAKLNASFPKPYFYASMIGYIIGMLTTLVVMGVFQHAQPALLYLVPGVLVSLWGTALVRGEIKTMWEFSEAVGEPEAGEDKAKSKDEDVLDLDTWQTWVDVWNSVLCFLGLRETTKPSKGTKIEAVKGEEDAADTKNQDVPKKNKPQDDDAVVFSFSITRYQRSSSLTSDGEKIKAS
ncbi:hypothetical protein LTS10_001766 [Elasticomyces elasticus]|nr:hypothetical protein LTS10_001766 [Elasticomyces elasticus]